MRRRGRSAGRPPPACAQQKQQALSFSILTPQEPGTRVQDMDGGTTNKPRREGDTVTIKTVFINLTNHPSAQWSDAQRDAALALGFDTIIDVPAGIVPPTATGPEVTDMARRLIQKALKAVSEVVPRGWEHCANVGFALGGEMSLTCALASQIVVDQLFGAYVATTDRKSVETVNADGTVTKTSVFEFVQWRRIYI